MCSSGFAPEWVAACFNNISSIGVLVGVGCICISWGCQVTKTNFRAVQTLIAVDNKIVRTGLRESFKQDGFDFFTEVADRQTLQKTMNESVFDLIIMGAEINGFFVAPIVGALRNGRLKHHPFPIVIMLLAEGQQAYVQKIIEVGPDDVMMMPVAPGPMLRRVEGYAVRRRPFVVTAAYIGPDRRTAGPRPGTEIIPLVDVPNPLKSSIANVSAEQRQSEIDLTKLMINTLKMERYAVQLRWLDNTINTMFRENEVDFSKLSSFAMRIKYIVEDLPYRMRGELPVETTSLIQELCGRADYIKNNYPKVGKEDFNDIPGCCISLAAAIDSILDSPSCTSLSGSDKQREELDADCNTAT